MEKIPLAHGCGDSGNIFFGITFAYRDVNFNKKIVF
jgi:hypothetical protein